MLCPRIDCSGQVSSVGMGAFIEDGSVAIVQLSGRSVYCDLHETKERLAGARL